MSQPTPSYKRRHIVKGLETQCLSEQYPEFGELCRREDHQGIDRWLEETEFMWNSESVIPIAVLNNVIDRGEVPTLEAMTAEWGRIQGASSGGSPSTG